MRFKEFLWRCHNKYKVNRKPVTCYGYCTDSCSITVYHHPTNTDRLWVECIGFENATGGTGDWSHLQHNITVEVIDWIKRCCLAISISYTLFLNTIWKPSIFRHCLGNCKLNYLAMKKTLNYMHEIHKHCEPPVFDRKVTGGKLLQI